MVKKTLFLLILALGLIVLAFRLLFGTQKSSLSAPKEIPLDLKTEISASKTLKTYSDASGFSFNYPDNLSLVRSEAKDNSTYADIQLNIKGVGGGLNLKIVDSKFKTLDDWAKTISAQAPKETNLGSLKATEVINDNKIMLGAIDQGVLFTIETSLGDKKDFWMDIEKSVIKDFSFVQPTKDTTPQVGSSDEVSFEGEEAVD